MKQQSGYSSALTRLCPGPSEVSDWISTGSGKDKIIRLLPEHAQLEKFGYSLRHRDLSPIAILRCSGFESDGFGENINLLDVHVQEFADSPAIGLANLDDCPKPRLGARSEQLLVLRVL